MKKSLTDIYADLKRRGLSAAQEATIRRELAAPERAEAGGPVAFPGRDLYGYQDLDTLQRLSAMHTSASANIRSIDELLERDRQREQDGFPPQDQRRPADQTREAGQGKSRHRADHGRRKTAARQFIPQRGKSAPGAAPGTARKAR